MLSTRHVVDALEAKRERFLRYERGQSAERERYQLALQELRQWSAEDILRALADVSRPGAWPTAERQPGEPIVRAFALRWRNHQEARRWAIQVLDGTTVVAVDGSQITPAPEFSMPVGAIQIGWFQNPHQANAPYVKDIYFEVLAPDELQLEEVEGAFPDRLVNARRFELECERLVRTMEELAGCKPCPVCFFDGSLIISFAAQLAPPLRRRYVENVRRLIDTSVQTKVPLVGYVDGSRASDLVRLLSWLGRHTQAAQISDGALLRTLMDWGDRTEALVCARDDGVFDEPLAEASYYDQVCFCYLKTARRQVPARLDIPRWVLEAGLWERVVDIVRAEAIVGVGYPYALETADAVSVISQRDRDRFYRLFQDFLARDGVQLRYALKAYSKRVRR